MKRAVITDSGFIKWYVKNVNINIKQMVPIFILGSVQLAKAVGHSR
ncbi:hypothetical protein BXY41_12160 [Lacrimispora xylanisolvens]|uniref:Uncharacterized protein n=1 Tax=Lacrimispora xylanisolvens TaxID=384636 RepID=A0A2S6HCC6_9FIRM|nr:hypothetical protein BXY41_12160 [Hungatella xylanolytica]